MSPRAFDPAAIAALLELAEEEGAPRAYLRIYGADLVTRCLHKLKDGGWELRRATNPAPATTWSPGDQDRRSGARERRFCQVCADSEFCYCGNPQPRARE